MCCLKYEQDAYEDAVRHMPKNESFVQTPDGPGNVSAVNLLKEQVTVRLDSQPDSPRCYHNCEVCVLRNGKGSRDGIEVPEERPARRVVTPEEAEEFPAVVSDFRFTTPEPVASGLDERKEGGRPSRSRRRRGGRGRGGEERSAEKTGVARRRAIARSASSANTLSSGFGLPLSYFAQKLSRS